MAPSHLSPSFLEWGKGKSAFVLLHYFGGAALSWQWVAKAMPANTRCIALNLPGFGPAPGLDKPSLHGFADYVHQTLHSLSLEAFTLVGHSMGGKVALQVAADQPPWLRRVVLVAPSPPTQEPMPEAERQRMLKHHPGRKNAETTVSNATKATLSDSQHALAVQTHMTAEKSAWDWWLQSGMNHSIADQMGRVQVPVTVIASQDDPVIPFETIQTEVMAYFPQATLVKTAQVGHLMPLECPEFLAAVIGGSNR
jgi:pimeloyl-ACP methyl ester carboxylesterase